MYKQLVFNIHFLMQFFWIYGHPEGTFRSNIAGVGETNGESAIAFYKAPCA